MPQPTACWWSAAHRGIRAAVAAKLAVQVVATESDAALAAKAKDVLAGLGVANVTVVAAAAAAGEPSQAPYDVIILDGATQIAPESLYEQLTMGGAWSGFCRGQPPRVEIVTRSPHELWKSSTFRCLRPHSAGHGAACGIYILRIRHASIPV